ncbi:MAG: RND transporter [Candidatus Binatia bacterium]|nr:MAG: RND transporter [Candidatus Binatia bacterium]
MSLLLCAVFSTGLLGWSPRVAAEQPNPEPTPRRTPLSLSDCIRSALASDPDLQAASAEIAAAQARLAQAELGRLGEAEYRQILGFVPEAKGDILDPPKQNRNAVFRNLGPFTQLEVMFHFPLWTFGKLRAALDAAQQGLAAQHAAGEVKRAEIVLNVKRLYYGVLLADQLARVLADMRDNMDKAIRKVQERLAKGSTAVTEIDLLKLQAGRAKLARGYAEVDASATLARKALARAIGGDVSSEVELAERRLEPVALELEPVGSYVEEARRSRPEAAQISHGLAAQAAKVEMQRAELFPTLFLSTGFQYALAPNRTTQRNPFAAEDFNYSRPVGVLGIRWELDVWRKQAKVAEAEADLAKLQAQHRSAMTGLELEVHRAYAQVVQTREAVSAATDGRKAGRALLVATVSNFDLGIGEAEELFKGLGTYTEASTDYFRAVHDFNVAVAELSRAVGKELLPLEY